MENKIRLIYRIEGGILNGTEIEPIMSMIAVKYPHRKTKDLYIPPLKMRNKEYKNWHCCQDNCPNPDFKGGIDKLIEHLMLHKGRLLKAWSKSNQLKSPIPAIKIPPNEWDINYRKHPNSTNEDRQLCVKFYIDNLKRYLRKQGIEILE